MAKYTFSFADAQSVATLVSIIGGDSKTEITFGAGEAMTAITVYGGVRQIGIKVKTENTETEEQKVVFETKTLSALLSAVVPLKTDVKFEVSPAICYIEVEGKARLPLIPVDAEGLVGIPLTQKALLWQARATSKDALKAFKIGGGQAMDGDSVSGMSNVLLTVKSTSQLEISSINGISAASSNCQITGKEPEGTVAENLKKYLDEKGYEELMIPVPRQIATDIISLLSGSESVLIACTDKEIHLMPASSVIYSAKLGAVAFTKGTAILQQMRSMPTVAQVTVDSAALKESISLLRKAIELTGKKQPMEVTLTSDEVRLEPARSTESVVRVKTVEGDAAEISKAFDGSLLLEAISSFAGNITISFMEDERTPALITSGTVSTPGTDIVMVTPVKLEAEESEEDETEGTENE